MTNITKETELVAEILNAAGWEATDDENLEGLQKILPQIDLTLRTTPFTRKDFRDPAVNQLVATLKEAQDGLRYVGMHDHLVNYEKVRIIKDKVAREIEDYACPTCGGRGEIGGHSEPCPDCST